MFFRFLCPAQSAPTWEWVTPIRASYDLDLKGIALDGAGNSYVAGWLNGQATFGATVLNSRGWNDMVVAKYNAQGQCLWARQAGPAVANPVYFGPRTYVYGLTVDVSGHMYVLGTSKERTVFDNVEIPSSREEATYLAKYSPQGNIMWVRKYDFSWPGDVVTDDEGSLYITHCSPVNANGYVDGVLVSKLDAQGNISWSRGAWSAATTSVGGAYARVAIGPNREVYLTCAYRGNVALDALPGQARTPLPSVMSGVFLARYTAGGTLDWVRTGYAPGAAFTGFGLAGIAVTGLAVDGAGNAIIAGYADAGTVVLGSLSLPPRGGFGVSDGYLIKYNAQGQLMWGHLEGSTDFDTIINVATDGADNIYALGGFNKGQASYGGIALTGNSTYQNNALVKYDPQGNAVWGLTQDGGELEMHDVAVSPTGDVYVAGVFYNAFRLGAHAVPYSSPGAFKRESVVAKLKSNTPPIVSNNAMFIPNIITPNMDGANDQFKTPGLTLGQWSCTVYNRWGTQVFHAPYYQQDWQAQGLADGIYYYLLANGRGEKIKGWVEVRR
ncbi:gliding motility-associated C-terminal domain-containing protein [Hymenobacter sp. BT770]|uniref:T9SS type B sorting domain-containing protein n=1 Tax=Hymenobacter sp. BT770 TaxID=2886942 RepID=UPI001D100121|nr:gliding motility-associated C-terminal domain-containing protein [Hymenobacter sp. BT770]MCC3153288.1 gliding motility-associated C-terminal domain-containing protein [Hymenobacter sp. BT770]MDO3414283.1 gliding motility-associated C-terminal domain-containing protein [Hymenobacter sp. BT770]